MFLFRPGYTVRNNTLSKFRCSRYFNCIDYDELEKHTMILSMKSSVTILAPRPTYNLDR